MLCGKRAGQSEEILYFEHVGNCHTTLIRDPLIWRRIPVILDHRFDPVLSLTHYAVRQPWMDAIQPLGPTDNHLSDTSDHPLVSL